MDHVSERETERVRTADDVVQAVRLAGGCRLLRVVSFPWGKNSRGECRGAHLDRPKMKDQILQKLHWM